MTPPKRKKAPEAATRALARVMLERFAGLAGDLSRQFSGLFGMLHEIKNTQTKILERVTPPANGTATVSRRPQKVASWKVSLAIAPYLNYENPVTDPAQLAGLLAEITRRAHTLQATGHIAILTFEVESGRLEMWSREDG
jgi:hypothetical protein